VDASTDPSAFLRGLREEFPYWAFLVPRAGVWIALRTIDRQQFRLKAGNGIELRTQLRAYTQPGTDTASRHPSLGQGPTGPQTAPRPVPAVPGRGAQPGTPGPGLGSVPPGPGVPAHASAAGRRSGWPRTRGGM
jgi:hypothetical protein